MPWRQIQSSPPTGPCCTSCRSHRYGTLPLDSQSAGIGPPPPSGSESPDNLAAANLPLEPEGPPSASPSQTEQERIREARDVFVDTVIAIIAEGNPHVVEPEDDGDVAQQLREADPDTADRILAARRYRRRQERRTTAEGAARHVRRDRMVSVGTVSASVMDRAELMKSRPIRVPRPPHCNGCLDTGWISKDCPATPCGRWACTDPDTTGHSYVKVCPCRPMNPVIERRRRREAKRPAEARA